MSHGNNSDGYSDGVSNVPLRGALNLGDAPSFQSSREGGSIGERGLSSPYFEPSPPRQELGDEDSSSGGSSSSISVDTCSITSAGSSCLSLHSSPAVSFSIPSEIALQPVPVPMRSDAPVPMPLPVRREAPPQQDRKRPSIDDREALGANVDERIDRIWPTHQFNGAMPSLIQLYMGNLPGSVTEEDIISLVFNYAAIRTVLVDFIQKKGKYAFITILEKDKDKAISLLHKKLYQGNQIKVDVATNQKSSPPTKWSTEGRVCFCNFSQSDAGRCEVDELTHIDAIPLCPFGSHDRGMYIRLCTPAAAVKAEDKKPTPEELSRRDNKRRKAEEQSVAIQRQKAADPTIFDEQAAKCRDLLERKSEEDYEPAADADIAPLSHAHKRQQQEARDAAFAERAQSEEMDYTCVFGSKEDTLKFAKELVENMISFYCRLGKDPRGKVHEEDGMRVWNHVRKVFPQIALAIRQLLIENPEYCEEVGGEIIFRCREMIGGLARAPGNYTLVKYGSDCTKHGMTNNITTGTEGRVDQQIPKAVSPYECSTISITRDESVGLVKGSFELRDLIDSSLQQLPAFQCDDDQKVKVHAKLVNETMEYTLTSSFKTSNGYPTERGHTLENVLNLGSPFVNEMCQFPDETAGDNRSIANYTNNAISVGVIGTWSTNVSDAYNAVDKCDDARTLAGVWCILKKRPKGDFLTKLMYLELLESLEDTNPRYSGFSDAVKTNPVTEVILGYIKQIDDAIKSNETDERKAKLCKFIISQFDNKTKYENVYHPPDAVVLARATVDEMKERIKEAREKLKNEPSSEGVVIICVEQFAIDAIQKQPWGPITLKELISSEEEGRRWIGRNEKMAVCYRLVPNTRGRICFAVIQFSFGPILGQGNVHQYSDTTRIQGVLGYVALVGLFASAGIISREHAEKLRRKCLSLLITWEEIQGDFGHKQIIKTSKLNSGIIQFLPIGFNQGGYVQAGSVALSHQLSPNGMNPYFMVLMLVRLRMEGFAELIRILPSDSDTLINQRNLRETMDKLVEERKRVDLGKRPEWHRKNMRDGHERSKKKNKPNSKAKKKKSKKKKRKKMRSDIFIDLEKDVLQDPILRDERSSQYKGVRRRRGTRYAAKIVIKGNTYLLGTYNNEEVAARAYATAVSRYRTTGELPDTIDWANVELSALISDPILRVEVSRYKGVYYNGARGYWFAEISIDGILYSLGHYKEEEKAAVAFATAVVKYRNQRNQV